MNEPSLLAKEFQTEIDDLNNEIRWVKERMRANRDDEETLEICRETIGNLIEEKIDWESRVKLLLKAGTKPSA